MKMEAIEAVDLACSKIPKWYEWHRFRLIPKFEIKRGDRFNNSQINFYWLIFRFWTMDSLRVCLQLEIEDTIQIRMTLPYVTFGLFIPIFPYNFLYKFWRKSEGYKSRWKE